MRALGSPFPAAAPAGMAVPGREGSEFPLWRIQAVGKAVAWLGMSGSSVGDALGVQQNETEPSKMFFPFSAPVSGKDGKGILKTF